MPRLGDWIRALCGTVVVHESNSGLKWITHAGTGGALSLSSHQDESATLWMDGEELHRCASCSAAGADQLPRSVRDLPRCLCCRRVDGRQVFDIVHI